MWNDYEPNDGPSPLKAPPDSTMTAPVTADAVKRLEVSDAAKARIQGELPFLAFLGGALYQFSKVGMSYSTWSSILQPDGVADLAGCVVSGLVVMLVVVALGIDPKALVARIK